MSFPLQTSVPLYQSKTTAGQDMTGPGQARVANGGVFATVGATDKQLFGRVAAYSGSYNEYAIFPNATTTAAETAGIFFNDKLHQNPPSQYGSEPTFSEGDRVSVLKTGRVTVQTIGTLVFGDDIYVYIGTTEDDWGKLQNTSTAGVLLTEFAGTDTHKINLVSSEDGLAVIDINF